MDQYHNRFLGLFAVCCLMLATAAQAQPRTMEQVIGAEIGQCILVRSAMTVENEALKARIAELEKQLKEKSPPPEKPQ